MDIEEFIDATNAALDFDRLNALMKQAIGQFGYEQIIYFSELGPELTHYDGTYEHFIKAYNARNLKASDPVLHLFFTHNIPFTHEQIIFDALAPEQRDIMKLHHANGIVKGYNVPLGRLSDKWVGVSLGSNDASARDDKKAQSQLYALVNQYALRYAQLCRKLPHCSKELTKILGEPSAE